MDSVSDPLPPEPQKPLPSDCCGQGCSPCVNDIYDQELLLWQKECDRIKNGSSLKDPGDQSSVLCRDEYVSFPISTIHELSEDSRLYRFAVAGYQTIPLAIGQHLILRWRDEDKVVTRQYTPVLVDNGFFDVVIKVYPDGEMSEYVRSWQVGDMVEWRGPQGNFTYKANQRRHLVLLAAGTGIAPMLPIIRHIVTNDSEDTLITLLYSCRTYKDALCKHILDELSGYWNMSVTYYISQGDISAGKYGEKLIAGRLTEERLQQHLQDKADAATVLICGTRAFDKDMINYVQRLGIKQNNMHKF